MPKEKHLKYKICISGSARGRCARNALLMARELGKQAAQHNLVVVSGATTGIPYEVVLGAKSAGGITVGISPAASKLEHIKKYHLPVDNLDLIIYTGFNYSGRNLFLVRATDAVVLVCGRIGTLNEFTIAFEDRKPIGILTGSGGISDEIKHILDVAKRGRGKIVYDSDPKKLIEKVIRLIKKEEKENGI
jgi:uncharacterized protein (TIGR00725 family)